MIGEANILGLIGGMGPLASAAFMHRIYQYHSYGSSEQTAPFVIHYSDPSIPDRTDSFLKGEESRIIERLMVALQALEKAGATHYIICCFTIHHIVPRLPLHYREKIISLIDVTVDRMLTTTGNYLFLATTGTRKMKLLESHRDWNTIKTRICMLSDQDQELLHHYIYNNLKKGADPLSIRKEILAIINNYDVTGVIVGCTEIHLLNNADQKASVFEAIDVIDALDILAKNPLR